MEKGVKYVRVRGKKLSGTWERRTGRLRQTFLTLTFVLAIVRDKTELSGLCGGVQWASVWTCKYSKLS